jgi:hypothetical protein
MGGFREVDGTWRRSGSVRIPRFVSCDTRIEPIQMSTPRGIRDNNPGNIRKSDAPWRGKVFGTDPDFETFDTPENGIRALAKTLDAYQSKHGCRTVRQIIYRWAPPGENDTAAYVEHVSASVGVSPDDTIIVDDPSVMLKLTVAIIQHENGQQPYSLALISAAIDEALA